LPSLAANFSGIPIVFDYLDHLEESASIYYPGTALEEIVKVAVRLITRFNLRQARSVITINRELSEYLRGIGIKEITEIVNGVDTGLLRPLPMDDSKRSLGLKGPVLGYVGSLEHWVDLETAVSALPRLDCTLLIVGPGLFTDYGDKIKMMAKELGVEGRVVFTGAVEYGKLSTYISAMDIGLNPLKKMKKNEVAIGGKVFNYLACGRPVLSSRMIALENELGDEIYYYDDEDSFVSQTESILALQRAGGDSPERHRMVAERYDWRLLARKYEAALEKALFRRQL